MLGVFTDAGVDVAIIEDRRPDDVVASGPTAEQVERLLGIAVEFPQQFGTALAVTGRVETVNPAVAATHHHLRLTTRLEGERAGPLAVQDVQTGRLVAPDELAGVLVEADEAGSVRGRDVDVIVVHAVAGDDEAVVSDTRHRTRTHVVLEHAQRTHHVVAPNDVGLVLVLVCFGLERAVVLTVVEALHVEAQHFTAAGVVPKPRVVTENGRADPQVRPVVHATSRQLGRRGLPQKLARLLLECDQAAQIDLGRIPLEIPMRVVGADEHLAVRHDGVAIRL